MLRRLLQWACSHAGRVLHRTPEGRLHLRCPDCNHHWPLIQED
jgi:hypothetical protein